MWAVGSTPRAIGCCSAREPRCVGWAVARAGSGSRYRLPTSVVLPLDVLQTCGNAQRRLNVERTRGEHGIRKGQMAPKSGRSGVDGGEWVGVFG